MKDPLNRTKVVLRHLPPSISESALMEQIDGRFSGRYRWFSFRPGKHSQKNQRYSRAYIDFLSPEDVIDFAEFFSGHIFVNEKGSQFKALVEYAPSQRVPKVLSKRDGREGTIYKDAEYLEFLEFIAKPVDNLPSAEIQLERREAERSGGSKEAAIVTPLMDFIRQKRAAKSGCQRLPANGKLNRRAGGSPSSSSSSSKRASEKRRGPTSVYVLRDNAKTSTSRKDKSAYMLVSRKEEQSSRTEASEEGTVVGSNETTPIVSGTVEIGKRRVVLLKGKEREPSHLSGSSMQQNATASIRNVAGSTSKQNQRQEAGGRIIRSILSNKDSRQSQSFSTGVQSEMQTQAINSERDKRPPRPPNVRHSAASDVDGKRSIDDKAAVSSLQGSVSSGDKSEKCTRNRDRPDRGVWTPRRSDGLHASDDISLAAQQLSDSLEGAQKDTGDDMGFQSAHGGRGGNLMTAYDAPLSRGEMKPDLPSSKRNAESRGGRANIFPAENGSYKHIRRGSGHGMKEVDGSLNISEGKPSKRGASAGYGSHEKQVWVQKSGSGT